MATELANKKAEREALRGVIQQWNANRLDLFELSEPNEDLEFHGVMRFYFQDSGQKVATKCIRVASDATSQAVIETLIEKFRPDMRMLSVPEYALYEIHENGEERKLGLEEKPLLVQLNWHIDDREGRFLLKRIDDKTNAQGVGFTSAEGSSFRRKLSKREKKQIKKQEKLSRLKSLEQDENMVPSDQNGVAEKLYTELPETSFTRSISNPEAVMRRRRQQKLEKKLQQFRSKDGGPDTGGTLKIYGEALCKDVPYKTLLLSVRDSAAQVVREMLSKYGLEKVDPQLYCLVQVNSENMSGNAHQEYILDDDECPLAILMNHPSTRGSIMFHVRRRPADYMPRKRKKKPAGKWNELDHRYEDERLPFLLELNPDGSDIPNGTGVRHRLQPNVTEVGSERPIGPQAVQAQTLTLPGPTVMPRHCVIAFTENIVTLTPCSRDAHTYVNNQRIHQTTILQNGAIIKFGRMHTFRFIDPAPEDRIRQRHDSNKQIDYAYDRRSPDATSQDVSSEKFRPGSGTPNGGQTPGQAQERTTPSSPTKSATTRSPRSPTHAPEPTHNYETTFDLDGNVETASLSSSRDGNRLSQYERQPRGTDPILPAVLEFLEETEETFLHAVITDVEPSAPQFKLAPTYTLYLSARYRASTHYRPELQPTERAHRLTVMLANVATMIQRVIQERYMDASSLAFWLANGSELLHMLKSDRHVGAFSTRAQDILADAVHAAFGSLVRCVSLELTPAMTQFMADADEPAKEAGVLQIFSNTMALLRRCRVNAALTIQLFSHLFHTINATAFNTLVSNGNLCVRWFGRRLKARLNALETWAERQGLELASQCHLATIMQATHLLQAPKYNAEELATLSSTCFKLNSLQVRALLQKYQPAADEPRLPAELIENVVRVAESVADTLARADGREIRLEEEPVLGLALLLPEDGYSCEVIRGVPPGLAEFLAPLQRDGLCRMAAQPTSSGYWSIYMIDHHNNLRSPSAMSNRSGGYNSHISQIQAQPEIHVIKLHKSTNGMGLSIVAAKGAGQDRLGIYIKSVVAGGAADADGRLTAGDQLLKVDGQSLVGITQEKAAEYLVRTGPIVTLEVAKQGAIYHGLATLLSQPSPVMTRACKIRPRSELLEPTKPAEVTIQPVTSHSMADLLSYPKQATCQDLIQPGAISSQRLETPFYRNQLDRFQQVDLEEYHSQQSPSFIFNQRSVYPVDYSVDELHGSVNEGDYICRPSTPTISNTCIPKSRISAMNCPLISITSDNATSYVMYQDGSDESDDKIMEEEENNIEEGEIATGNFKYLTDTLNPFERIMTPPEEYAEALKEYKHTLLTQPLNFDRNVFDTIPYIDQTDDISFTEASECVQEKSSDGCEHHSKTHCDDNFNLQNSQKKTNINYNNQQTLNVTQPNSELHERNNLNSSSIDIYSMPTNKSVLSVKDSVIRPGSTIGSKFNKGNGIKHTTNTNERSEDKSDDVYNSEDCADESSSTTNDDYNLRKVDKNTAEKMSTSKIYSIIPELHLDLSGLNSDVSSDESKTEKCWKSPEEVRLGCGRVAALAKHFSKLGDAGLIRLKSTKLADSRQFVSEPNIMRSEKDHECLGESCSKKEYKSDSDLIRETTESSRFNIAGKCNVILVDNNLIIEGCKVHHCKNAKSKTISRFPSMKDYKEQHCIATKKSSDSVINENANIKDINQILSAKNNKTLVEVENHNVLFDNSKDQTFLNTKKNVIETDIKNRDMRINIIKSKVIVENEGCSASDKDISIKDNDSKLSLEEQQVIVKQLEHFSNLDNTDAPLFIPERTEQILGSFSNNKYDETLGNSNLSTLKNQQKKIDRDNSSLLINTGQRNKEKTKKNEISLPFFPTLSCSYPSTVLPLSNIANNSLSSEDTKSHQHYERHPISCLFIDISHSSPKNGFDENSSENRPILPSRASSCSRLKDHKFNILRVRIARPFHKSENDLIDSAICRKNEVNEATYSDKLAKVAHSYENISNKFLSNSIDRTRSFDNLHKDTTWHCNARNKLNTENKEKIHWCHYHPFEKLKLKKEKIEQGDSINSSLPHTIKLQIRSDESCNRLDFGNRENTQWNFHRSFEDLKPKRKFRQRDSLINSTSDQSTAIQKSDKIPKRHLKKRVNHNWLKGSVLELSRDNEIKDKEGQWSVKQKSQSELDISRRMSDSEKDYWSFRKISLLKDDDRSALRPRRMSERDLPSRLGHDTTPQQIHSSKSVPALHNVGTETKQQHEVFNPGYSRASSSNSITPPVQPPPMATINSTTSLHSRSSHNLHDPMRIGTLPPTGLVSRQQSSPNLNPNTSHINAPANIQNTEAERFYQNLSIYRNQDSIMKQQISPQQSDDRNPQHIQKNLRGSQNSLNRPSILEISGHVRDRPTSAYVTQGQQQSYASNQMQHQGGGPPSRSQSSRDIIRQEAKLQEMQEEVRRRELRGGAPILNQHRQPPMYNVGTRAIAPPQQPPNSLNIRSPRLPSSTSNLGTVPAYSRQNAPAYNYPDSQYAQYTTQYGQYGQYNQYAKYPASGGQYGVMPKSKNEAVIRGHAIPNENLLARDSNSQDPKIYGDQHRHFAGSQNNLHYPNGNMEQRVDQYANDGIVNRAQNGETHPMVTTETAPTRPTLPEDRFNESPPPPPPNTSTHPLYSKQSDTRYTASMQDPPRGGYYPAGGIGGMQQPRQYQYSATNPWQREEREKEQARRREAARQWRDQQISELSAMTHRTQQQEEQLRALQLERDFQKRAEEAANQDDDEESNDLDNESVQRVQGLLRMAASQDRTVQTNQQHVLSRANVGNQSMRNALSLQPVNTHVQPTSSHSHVQSNQSGSQNTLMGSPGQDNTNLQMQPNQLQQLATNQNEEHMHLSSTYGTPLSHFGSGQKSYSVGTSHSVEERELHRRMDEVKRKQAEFEEDQKKQDELRQHQLQSPQQTYQPNQHPRSQQPLHPGMLRLDNLIINGPNTSMPSQNNVNDAPPPPERGSSYAIMSQQSALRSNGSTTSNILPNSQQSASMKRVSFHDSNSNSESMLRNVSSGTSNAASISMDTIREDPNNFITDAENLLASPKTPEGSGTSFATATPGVIGAQEVYKDPRQKRLAEKQKQQQNSQIGAVPEKLSFKEKMKMFAMETGEDGTPRDKVKISRAQREIDNISSPLNPNNNNNNNNNNNTSGNNNNGRS